MSHSAGTRGDRARLAGALTGLTVLALLLLPAGGCTPFAEYVRNGFKVGPNYHEPAAPVAADWIDADPRVVAAPPADAWWGVFGDPTLDSLIETARQQNLDLKAAATRVLQARAQRNIAAGNLLPQTQQASAPTPTPKSARTAACSAFRPPAARRAGRPAASRRRPRSTCGPPASTPRGNSTSGAASAATSRRPTPSWAPPSRTTMRPGHAAGRRGDQLRPAPHLPAAHRLRPQERRNPAAIARLGAGAAKAGPGRRPRRGAGPVAAGADRGVNPAFADRFTAGRRPAVRPARPAAAGAGARPGGVSHPVGPAGRGRGRAGGAARAAAGRAAPSARRPPSAPASARPRPTSTRASA